MVSLITLDDLAQQALVESVLRDSAIPFEVRNEQTQHLIGYGELGGFNVAIGPLDVRVAFSDHARARQLLGEVLDSRIERDAPELQPNGDVSLDSQARRHARQSAILAILWFAGIGSLSSVYLGIKALETFKSATPLDRFLARFGVAIGLLGFAASLLWWVGPFST